MGAKESMKSTGAEEEEGMDIDGRTWRAERKERAESEESEKMPGKNRAREKEKVVKIGRFCGTALERVASVV